METGTIFIFELNEYMPQYCPICFNLYLISDSFCI